MSINRYRPHLLVLPEDESYKDMANGFNNHHDFGNKRVIQVLPPAGGWKHVLAKCLNDDYEMKKYTAGMILLLIDFDNKYKKRFECIKRKIEKKFVEPELRDRIFVLGVLSEAESLKKRINLTYEQIGEALYTDCVEKKSNLWSHDLLKHNETELKRMMNSVNSFLFN